MPQGYLLSNAFVRQMSFCQPASALGSNGTVVYQISLHSPQSLLYRTPFPEQRNHLPPLIPNLPIFQEYYVLVFVLIEIILFPKSELPSCGRVVWQEGWGNGQESGESG